MTRSAFTDFDPVRMRRFVGMHRPGGLSICLVQLHQMLSDRTLRRLRLRFVRLHYQFVMANERRAAYDYFMLVCGPAPFDWTVRQPQGPMDLFADDGSLREPGVPTLSAHHP